MPVLAALETQLQDAHRWHGTKKTELAALLALRRAGHRPPTEQVIAAKREAVKEARLIIDAHLIAIARAEVG